LRYLDALVAALKTTGARLFGAAHVKQVHGGADARVITAAGPTVTAKTVVVATNTPINDRVAIHTKQVPHRTFAIALSLPRGRAPHALLWDTGDPYRYVRGVETTSGDFLIVGGEDHKTGQYDDASERFDRLEAWARSRFSHTGARTLAWSGQVLEPIDSLAFIGRNPLDRDNVFIATGDSGHGLTHGVIAGLLICDLVLGRPNPWETLYDPSRRSLKTIGEFTANAFSMAAGYADWLKGSDIDSVDDLARGHAALLRRGARKIAAYRDEEGELHLCSARCTHLGGVVHWNSIEKSWDCPLHGSRFNPDGQVLSGPATTSLDRAEKSGDHAYREPAIHRPDHAA